ncbi:[FeFe] hydrogenase H-cluster maturation GTPase HydF [Abyssisolibacter fermentans]|uniref:[FeFe] hydrogenase H-cluster maturation GTPase HydF n=1 Tax=Abyssisolibacter fermentans TaxID=1766203 RepID=UPI0008368474|nr:[FeFe] hydrogenase H-cluster maturation GTPase HydF [Abyssisolibacter fermentans]
MSLNETPRSNRVHIALFGKRNAGKSSVINAITNQDIAIVSEVKGTTTDPVYKSMEILPIGPCVIIDTAGIDDFGSLGELRVKKSLQVLNKTDVALIIVDAKQGITDYEKDLIEKIKAKKIPLAIVLNKIDLIDIDKIDIKKLSKQLDVEIAPVSAIKRKGIEELKEKIIEIKPQEKNKLKLVGDLIKPTDFVILVTPIDKAAPKGRLILPQQQTIRDILDHNAISVVVKESELKEALEGLKEKAKLVITDSQAFEKVSKDTPDNIPLTSFSILFARFKGDLIELIKGAKAIDSLKDGDKILISEACTHHRQDDDIGKVKIPRWLLERTGKKLEFEFSSGTGFTEEVKKYSLIIHCGGCMLNRAGMVNRIDSVRKLGVPIVNYGVFIAYIHGILDRALEPFPEAKKAWNEVN